ncbi:hypothetical protein LIER_42058 [Lithospermum erythrorhizon]|uniref:Replication protein A OB domain-containing protein n=1 Tax=Lithospermum erythrorhizon TaxID=34254 RepID=A0AAV3RIR5_LITER
MEKSLVLIPAVTRGMTHWIVKVTITKEMPTLVGYQRGTRYKRYMLTDVEVCNTIPTVVYGPNIVAFSNTLHLHGVYAISNAVIKLPSSANVSAFNTLHWVLQCDTLIFPLLCELNTLCYFLDTIITLCDVGYAADVDDVTVDIMPIVIKVEDIKPVTTKFGEGTVQRFVIVDAGRTPIPLSIWHQQIEHHGANLTAAAASYSVVVAKRLKVKTYCG